MNQAIDLFDAFATDTVAEEEGILTTLPDCGDIKWRIARVGNATYNQVLAKLYKRHRLVLDSKGKEAQAKSDSIMAEVYAKSILLGWEGTVQFQGKAHPYSEEVALKLLSLKDFRSKVANASEDFATFKAKQEAEDEKN